MITSPTTTAVFPYTTLFRSTLFMLIVAIMGLTAVQRRGPGQRLVLQVITLGVPSALGLLILIWMWPGITSAVSARSEEHTSELQSHVNLVCRLLLEKKKMI